MLEIAVALQFVLIIILFMEKSFENRDNLNSFKAQEKLNDKVFKGFKLFDEDLKAQSDLNKIFSDKINDVITTTNALNDDLTKLIKIIDEVNECTNME